MKIEYRKEFIKQYKKLPKKIQIKFSERLHLFITDANHPLLHLHTLTGADYPIETINITGDYRAQFLRTKNVVSFIRIGTHSELY
jgi:mRNA-degrading endonuclease YafQ of YafQ-DinJ toxin-antitoxin module